MALSNSGKVLVTGECGYDSDIIVWDIPYRKMAYRFSEHTGGIEQLAISHDDRLLISAGNPNKDKKMIIWDLYTGNIVTSSIFASSITAVSWGGMAKDIKRRDTNKYQLVTASDRRLALWIIDPYIGEMKEQPISVGSAKRDYTCIEFNKDYSLAFAGSLSGDVCVLSIKHMALITTFRACHGGVGDIKYFGDFMIIGGGDSSLTVWSASADKPGDASKYIQTSAVLNMTGGVVSLSISYDGREALVGTSNGKLIRVQLEGSRVCRKDLGVQMLSHNHCEGISYISYFHDSSDTFATCSKDKTVRIWDASDYLVRAEAHVTGDGTLEPRSIAYSPDGLYSGWSDGMIRCNSSENGKQLWEIKDANRGGVTSMELSHNERFLLSGGSEGEIRVWELRSREMVSHLKEHTNRVNELILFDDDVHALSCSRDRSFLCWDLRREKRISSHSQRMGGINSIAVSRDQTQVLTVGQEKKITFWDLRVQTPVDSIDPAHDGEALCVTVSHKGNLFATGGVDQMVKFWDTRSSRLLADGIGHSGNVNCIRFAPDDKQATSVADDGNIFIWNIY